MSVWKTREQRLASHGASNDDGSQSLKRRRLPSPSDRRSEALATKVPRSRASTPRESPGSSQAHRGRNTLRHSGPVSWSDCPRHFGARCASTSSAVAMEDWVEEQRRRLGAAEPSSLRRLEQVFARGVDVTTHYSGTGAAEMAFAAIAAVGRPCLDAGVAFHSACDCDPTCQQVLMNHPPDSRAQHCFGNLCDRLPPGIAEQLWKDLRGYQKRASRASTPAGKKKIGKEWLLAAMAILSKWKPRREDRAPCVRHGKSCVTFPEKTRRLHVEVSGVNCQPWSCAGQRQGWLDDRSVPCLALLRTVMSVEPDAVCLERTPEFDFDSVRHLLADTYCGYYATTSPVDLGFPVARLRMYMWFRRRPGGHRAEPALDLAAIFRREAKLSPCAFLSSTVEEVQRYYRMLLTIPVPRRQGDSAGPQATSSTRRCLGRLHVRDVLRGGFLTRYHGHRAKIAALAKGRGPCYFVDINQTPGYRGPPQHARIPTILRTSTLVAMYDDENSDRLVLPRELLAMHGLRLPEEVAARLPARKLRSLVGNSMHVPQVGCFLLFCLGTRLVT